MKTHGLFNPPLGVPPTLEWVGCGDLLIDPRYQRSVETQASRTLIRRIARFWDWGLCQPLVAARREDGHRYVIDGQHRLLGARMRRDIAHLPCVVLQPGSIADEAAAFVALNQARRPLTALDVFKAAEAAGDEQASVISALIRAAGLSIAGHTNYTTWKPGMVSNIGGIQECYRRNGSEVTFAALNALGHAFRGQVLRYGGTIFGGLGVFYAEHLKLPGFNDDLFIDVLMAASQAEWRAEISQVKGERGVRWNIAGGIVFAGAYAEAAAELEDGE